MYLERSKKRVKKRKSYYFNIENNFNPNIQDNFPVLGDSSEKED